MRCRQARLRLTGSRQDESAGTEDRELIDHLNQCPACAREAAAAGTIRQMFAVASVNDMENVTPLYEQRLQIEARATRQQRPNVSAGMAKRERLKWRPVFGVGVAFVAAILIATLTLIPFQYDRTIGYEVAFAGVDRELVEEDERVCDMLSALGLIEAAVDFLGCDTTCKLTVFDLKSKQEVQLVVAAFAHVSPMDLTTDVIPVRATVSGSLLDRANERILR
jgi:hypothetical protein